MTERPIDVSTGRPADKRDHEVRDELREQHAEAWRDRDGEVIKRLVVGNGLTAFGQVFERGDVIECKVGDDMWVESCDPRTGQSFLDLDPEQQVARWKQRMLAVVDSDFVPDEAPTPTDDDRPHRPFAVRLPKSEQMMYDRIHAIWAEQEALADEPLRQYSAETRIPKDGSWPS